MKNKLTLILIAIICFLPFCGCENFLDERPYNSLTHPSSLKDLRGLLDFEWETSYWYPGAIELASDDFVMSYKGYSTLPPFLQDAYLWEDRTGDSGEWQLGYKMISIANVILESLERISDGSQNDRRQIEGEALFLRGWVLFNLAQVYCAPYSILGAKDNLGLVLRQDSDSNVKEKRATLLETYDFLFKDLNRAVDLLSNSQQYISRFSKLTALAALSRAYHTIEDYEKAEKAVDQVMDIKSELLDYNDIDYSKSIPLDVTNNIELLNFAASRASGYLVADFSTSVSPELYDLFEDNDLRKKVFFEETEVGVKFKGFYHGDPSLFAGMAIDEMYLIKAECLVRRNDLKQAELILNHLLNNRYKKGTHVELASLESEELLMRILEERRKELIFRGVRWLDLRRINRYPDKAVVLKKYFDDDPNQVIYTLIPNDLRYTFLIPKLAIDVGGYIQNPR